LFTIFNNNTSYAQDIDTEEPVITINGSNYVLIEKGVPWVDPGASAYDNVDGNVLVTTSGTVYYNTVGDHIIEYQAQDSAGNLSKKERIVRVVDLYDMRESYTFEEEHTYGGSYEDRFTSVIDTRDNGYVVVGCAASIDYDLLGKNNVGFDIGIFIKYDSQNKKVWEKVYGGSDEDCFSKVIETNDGGYIIVGYTSSNDGDIIDGNNGNRDALIVKFNSDGEEQWQKTFGGSNDDSFYDVVILDNGDIVAVGYTWSDGIDITDGNNGDYDALIVKFDALGNEIMQRTFGGSAVDIFYSVIKTNDGNFIAVGSTTSSDYDITDSYSGDTDALIVKFYPNGNEIWQSVVGEWNIDLFNDVVETNSGEYIAVGSSGRVNTNGGVNRDGYMIKYDFNGNILLETVVGGSHNDYIASIKKMPFGDFIITGTTYSTDFIDEEKGGFVITTNDDLSILTQNAIGDINSNQYIYDLTLTDNGFIVVGRTDTDIYYDCNDAYLYQESNYGHLSIDGIDDVVINLNQNFQENDNVYATDERGNRLSVTINGEVNNQVLGTYRLTYITSSNEFEIQLLRNVTVVDNIAPIITLNGSKYVLIEKNATWVDPGAIAIDNYDGEVNVITSGTVDLNVLGEYVIEYSAIDSSGNSNRFIRHVQVVDKYDYQANYRFHDDKTLGGSGDDRVYSSIETSDGGYLVVGATDSKNYDINDGNNGGIDGLIIKYDKYGNEQWQRTFGGSLNDFFMSVIETNDGYIVVGNTYSSDFDITYGTNGFNDGLIVKYDSNGNLLWHKTFGGSSYEAFYSIVDADNGNFVVAGVTYSNNIDITDGNNGSGDSIIVMFDETGREIWQRTIGGSESELLWSIVKTSDDCFISVGDTSSNDYDIDDSYNGSGDGLIIKIDYYGEVLWLKTMGGSNLDSFTYVTEKSDGSYLVAGYTSSNDFDIVDGNNGSSDGLIVRYDSSGNMLSQITYGGSKGDFLYYINETKDGGFIVLGDTFSNDFDIINYYGKGDALIVKFDINNEEEWQQTVGGVEYDLFSSFVELDNMYLFIGQTQSFGNGLKDGLLYMLYDLDDVSIDIEDDIILNYTDSLNFLECLTVYDKQGLDITNETIIIGEQSLQLGLKDLEFIINTQQAQIILKRQITITDNEKPLINNTRDIVILKSATNIIWHHGLTASDNYDGDITSNIEVDDSLVNLNSVGDYSLTYRLIDSNGNETIQSVIVYIVEDENPVFYNIPDYYIVEKDDINFNYRENIFVVDLADYTTTDFTINTQNLNINQVNYYDLIYAYTDSNGNKTEKIVTVYIVNDLEYPQIYINSEYICEVNESTDLSFGIIAADYTDGIISEQVIVNDSSVNYNTVGNYYVDFTIINSKNNMSNINASLFIVDVTAPIITLSGEDVINHEAGGLYNDLGVILEDNYDSDLQVIIQGSVNSEVLGSYVLTYYTIDSSGNESIRLTRTINVVDTTSPEFDGIVKSVQIEKGSTFDPIDGITVSDNYDSNLDINYSKYYDVNKSGEYIITLTSTDTSGNIAYSYYKLKVLGSKYTITIEYNLDVALIDCIINQKKDYLIKIK